MFEHPLLGRLIDSSRNPLGAMYGGQKMLPKALKESLKVATIKF